MRLFAIENSLNVCFVYFLSADSVDRVFVAKSSAPLRGKGLQMQSQPCPQSCNTANGVSDAYPYFVQACRTPDAVAHTW
jgi:hypothetical protein